MAIGPASFRSASRDVHSFNNSSGWSQSQSTLDLWNSTLYLTVMGARNPRGFQSNSSSFWLVVECWLRATNLKGQIQVCRYEGSKCTNSSYYSSWLMAYGLWRKTPIQKIIKSNKYDIPLQDTDSSVFRCEDDATQKQLQSIAAIDDLLSGMQF